MIELKMTENGSDVPVAAFYATESSAGFDVAALLDAPITIAPGSFALIPTGLSIVSHQDVCVQTVGSDGSLVPLRMIAELQLRPRSGLAAKYGITIPNSPATIDADYRGEIKVILMNLGSQPFTVAAGDRIAQGIVSLVVQLPQLEIKSTTRGIGGFGSTGK